MKLLLVGVGGHARTVADLAVHCGHSVAAYVDSAPASPAWLGNAVRIEGDDDAVLAADEVSAGVEGAVMGLGGQRPDQLTARHALFDRYAARFPDAMPHLVHPAATVADDCGIGVGTLVMAGAVVNAGATLGDAVVVNSGAIVEHDATVGDGAHVAPGAIVLGGARVGAGAMIGAGAVVLPGAQVPPGVLVKSLTRFAKVEG